MSKTSEDLRIIHKESEKLAQIARERGFRGRQLSLKEREKLAREYVEEKRKKGSKIE